MRFYLRPSISPTYFQLNVHLKQQRWRSVPYAFLAQVNEHHFDFDKNACEQLEYKHLLADLLKASGINTFPETHYIDEHNWVDVLEHIASQAVPHRWILKPSLLNNGQHIHLFETIKQVETHYLQSARLGGPHVLQRYLEYPHLLREHKYSIRVFVVLTNDAGGFLFPEGYLNVACHPYDMKFCDPRVHLTNEHLNHDTSNVIQIPASRLDLFADFYLQIKQILRLLLKSLTQAYPHVFVPHQSRRLAIYGFDFLADQDHKIWLLEANHGPCFPTHADHPLQTHVYDRFWRQLIDQFLVPIANKKPYCEKGDFERLSFHHG